MIDLSQFDQLKKHLAKYGLYAKKSFGQHFLVDSLVLDQIVDAAELTGDDVVVEVGAGPGALSQRLAPECQRLMALEIDEKFMKPWKDVMGEFKSVEIINQDVLQYQPPDRPYKLVANIPYYITSPILKHFLRNQRIRRPDIIVLLIQKEVAQRICDRKKPTLLSWEIRVFGEPEIVCPVPPKSFYPPPKVDSAVLKIRVYEKPLLAEDQLGDFFKMLSVAYKQPRKTLLNNLLASSNWDKEEVLELLENAGVDPGKRAHELSLEEWERVLKKHLSAV